LRYPGNGLFDGYITTTGGMNLSNE